MYTKCSVEKVYVCEGNPVYSVSVVCGTCSFRKIINTSSVLCSIISYTLRMLVGITSTYISKLDYCNSLLISISLLYLSFDIIEGLLSLRELLCSEGRYLF